MATLPITDRSSASALIPQTMANEIIKLVSQQSVALQMMRKLPNMSTNKHSIPVFSSLPTAYFVEGDTGRKEITKMEWEGVMLTAEEIAVIVPFPESVLADSAFNIEDEAMPAVIEAFAAKIDDAIFNGTSAPKSWPMGLIPLAKNKGHIVKLASTESDQDFYKKILGVNGLFHEVEKDGFMVSGIAGDPYAKAYIRGLTDTTGRPLTVGGADINGQRVSYLMNGAWNSDDAYLLAGDFTKAVYAIRQDMTVKRFTEGVIQDGEGNIVYNLMQNDMVALRFVMRLGWAVANPVSRINPDQETRYPFAVLTKNTPTELQTVTFTVSSDAGTTKVSGATVVLGGVVKKTASSTGIAKIDVPTGYSGEWTVFKDGVGIRTGSVENVSGATAVNVNNFAPEEGE